MEQEFRVRNGENARQDTRIRVFFFSVVMFLLLVVPVSMALRDNPLLGKLGMAPPVITIAVLVTGIIGAFVVANRSAMQRMKRSCVWRLTETELIMSREGWPDERIGLSEKASLYSRPGWLVVDSAESKQKIVIPEDIEGFQTLRRELTKHCPLVPTPPAEGSFWVPLAIVVAGASCIIVLTKAGVSFKIAAVASLSLLQCFQSIRTALAVRQSPRRVQAWCLLGFSWVFTLAVFAYLIWRH